jgi:membrane-associated phospholipid phosphatase
MSLGRLALAVTLLAWPLQAVDDAVRDWMRANQSPGTRKMMEWVTSKSRVVLIGGAVLGLVGGKAARWCLAETAIAVEGLKWTVNRARPDGDRNRKNSSFPSSHAANAFTVAFVVSRRYSRAAIPLLLAAALIAFSRMYLDRHWLSDVTGGLLLGLGGAWLAGRLMEWWGPKTH